MTVVVVGGSSGLGRALCGELAAQGRDLVIVASRIEDCVRLANHLHLLHRVDVLPLAIDARNPMEFRGALAKGLAGTRAISDLFLPMGFAQRHDQVGEASRTLEDLLHVNYAAVVAAIEVVEPLMPQEGGRIVGFGSIAAIRGRNRNVQYAAAKSALETYFEALRHSLVAKARTAQFYVVGYVESGQSFGNTQIFPPISASNAARMILRDGERDFGRRYLPAYWALVAIILRLLPWRVFSRLGF